MNAEKAKAAKKKKGGVNFGVGFADRDEPVATGKPKKSRKKVNSEDENEEAETGGGSAKKDSPPKEPITASFCGVCYRVQIDNTVPSDNPLLECNGCANKAHRRCLGTSG